MGSENYIKKVPIHPKTSAPNAGPKDAPAALDSDWSSSPAMLITVGLYCQVESGNFLDFRIEGKLNITDVADSLDCGLRRVGTVIIVETFNFAS